MLYKNMCVTHARGLWTKVHRPCLRQPCTRRPCPRRPYPRRPYPRRPYPRRPYPRLPYYYRYLRYLRNCSYYTVQTQERPECCISWEKYTIISSLVLWGENTLYLREAARLYYIRNIESITNMRFSSLSIATLLALLVYLRVQLSTSI
jgi:hypothetical protein